MRAHNDRRRWATGLALAGCLASISAVAAARPPEKAVDWTALNPAFGGATFVNDVSACAACHEDVHRSTQGNDCKKCHFKQQKSWAATP